MAGKRYHAPITSSHQGQLTQTASPILSLSHLFVVGTRPSSPQVTLPTVIKLSAKVKRAVASLSASPTRQLSRKKEAVDTSSIHSAFYSSAIKLRCVQRMNVYHVPDLGIPWLQLRAICDAFSTGSKNRRDRRSSVSSRLQRKSLNFWNTQPEPL